MATAADPVEQLGAAFAHSGHDSNVLFSDDPRGRNGLWAYREVLNEAVSASGVPLKLDVGLPIHALEAFMKQCASLCARASARPKLYMWGHLGDGNVHVNVVGAGADGSELAEEVLGLVAATGGTVSAEHGIGRAKTEWLHLTRSPAELDLIRAIKHAFGPSGVLSPGRVFPIGGLESESRDSPRPR